LTSMLHKQAGETGVRPLPDFPARRRCFYAAARFMQALQRSGPLTDNRGGVALILVIWVMVILVAIVGEFSYSMRTEISIVKNFKEEEEAYQLALSGIEAAKAEILASSAEPAGMYVNEDGILVLNAEGEEEPERKGDLGKGTFEYTIIDEEGKLNINTASRKQLRHIFRYTGVEGAELDTIVDSIIDWRDTDSLHMLNGAEEDYYQSLKRPYSCKDGPFDSVEELLLVKGMTPEIFLGSAGAGSSETGEEKEKKTYSGVARYLTVNGPGRININTAPAVVLEAVFGPEKADNIIVRREAGPVARPDTGGGISSDFFTVISTGSNADGTIRRTVKAILHRRQNEMEIVYWNDNIT